MHSYSEVETEMGKLRVGCNPKGIAMICLAKGARATFEDTYRKRFGIRPSQGRIPESFKRAVIKAAAGRLSDPVPVDLSGISGFHLKVLNALRRVPQGEVRTYGWLARKAGRPKAARAAGNAVARNPVPLLVPCHRVVPAAGGVGNYGLGSALKRELLAREGVAVEQL
jgi:methylated-DNA-[protein]-cysteine S-methyltransferase